MTKNIAPKDWEYTASDRSEYPSNDLDGSGPPAVVSAAITGTATASIDEADLVAGGKTIIGTLTNDTLVAAGATFDAQRLGLFNGVVASTSQTNGYNNEIALLSNATKEAAVVRTSDNVFTIIIPALATYDILSIETLTDTILAAALVTSVSDVVATPTIFVTATGASLTPLSAVSFDGLTSGQSIVPLIGAWGTFANGFGCEGDTSLKYTGATSSCNISIESGSTGDNGDGNGYFGYTVPITGTLGDGDEVWSSTLIYIPVGFSFSNNSFLKFLRYTQTGTAEKINTYLESSGSAQTTWNLQTNAYTQFQSSTNRVTGKGLVAGTWNWVVEYFKITSSTDTSIRRMWINDTFAMEHVGKVGGDVTTKWIDGASSLQTDTWTPVSGGFPVLVSGSSTMLSMFMSTYWNGGAPQDQSWNVQQHSFYSTDAGMMSDSYGNKFPHSSQVGLL